MSENWDRYFIELAELISSKSKDPSTKVGCVIVGPDNEIRSTGYNGFPRGVHETEMVRAAPTPYPVAVERDVMTGQWFAIASDGTSVSLGDLQINQRRGNFDAPMHPDDIKQQVMDLANNHEYFKKKPRVETVLHTERWERPLKYDFVEHAERNAVYNAARVGIPTAGCRAYLNWEPHPCKECTKAFIQAGIIEVIGPDRPFTTNNDWKFDVSRIMLDEAGVAVRTVDVKLDKEEENENQS